MPDRRRALALLSAVLAAPAIRARAETPVEVWKTPSCGCCAAWVDRMREAGFAVAARDVTQGALVGLKTRLGVTPETASCHTALIEGYVVEGHVPPGDVRRLLAERPDAAGLAVPGMPIGSPGMEMGDRVEPYATLLIGRDGRVSVFATHS